MGNWRNGSYHGKGIMLYPTGGREECDWLNGKENGNGIKIFSNGDSY